MFIATVERSLFQLKTIQERGLTNDKVISSEADLFKKGCFPKAVHFDVKKYKIDEILNYDNDRNSDPTDCSNWLLDIWKEKEAKLSRYYSKKVEERILEPSGNAYLWPVSCLKTLDYFLSFKLTYNLFFIFNSSIFDEELNRNCVFALFR